MKTTKSADTERVPWLVRVWRFYRDGFASMTVGRTLWLIIGIKLVVFFVIIKWVFFPNFLAGKSDTEEGKAEYVRSRLTPREQVLDLTREILTNKTIKQL